MKSPLEFFASLSQKHDIRANRNQDQADDNNKNAKDSYAFFHNHSPLSLPTSAQDVPDHGMAPFPHRS